MSIVDKDVALNLDTAYQTRNPNKLPVQRICYADDTVLISTNAAAANRLLLNGNNVVKFPDGQKLNRVEETTYLGHQIMPEMDMKHEIQHKMHQTLKTWFELDTFWKTTICSTRWKLQVYYDIIRNKLLYGLEPYTSRKRNKRKWMFFHCGAYIKSWVSAQLIKYKRICTAKICKAHIKKSAAHLAHLAK